MARRYPKSETGRYRVVLMRSVPDLRLKPGPVTVREAILKQLLAEEDLVTNVFPAD